MSKTPAPPPLYDEELSHKPLNWAIIKRLIQYTRPYARLRAWLMLTVILRALQLPLLVWAIGAAIDGPVSHGQIRYVFLAAFGYGLLAIITQLTFRYRSRLALQLGEHIMHDLRRDLFQKLQSMTMSYFHRTKVGRIIGRLTSDVEAIRTGVQDVVFVSMVNGGQMTVAAILMAFYNWQLFLVIVALAPMLWAINRQFRKRLTRSHRNIQESFSRVTASLAESINGIRVTQGFVRQDINAGLFFDLVADHSHHNIGLARTSGVFLPLLEFNSQAFIAVLLLVGGWQVLQPDPTADIGTLVQFFFMANLFFSPIQVLGNQYNQALAAMAGAERVFRLLDLEPDWQDSPDAISLGGIEGRVELRDLSFEYEPGRPVLDEVSFVAEPGDTIALVGHTGSGKSTIINLITKFYLPTSGQLLIDGHDITQISTASLRSCLGIVLQQNFLFAGKVIDNIRLARPNATDEQVAEAARSLDCLDLLEALPDGLDTIVGEKGSGISLGQRQLICFTRAMLANPRILILDEATSNIDSLTEARIQTALGKLFEGRTCFVVAHRLSTIRQASQILVLDNGRLTERGTHEQLLRLGGFYTELYRQFVSATPQ